VFATAIAAQPPRPGTPPDPLKDATTQRQIAEQKTGADITQTLENADRLAKSNRIATASQTLKTAKQNLQFTQGISETARTRFTAMLDAKLAAIEGRPFANPVNPGVKLDPKGPEMKAAQADVAAKYFAELKDVREGIKRIETAQAAGKTNEANAEVARLTKLYPTNPSVWALGQKDSMQNRVADAQAYYVEASRRWVANQKNINNSSLPIVNENGVEFPKDWAEKSKIRLAANTVQLTAKEKKIIEALDKPISVGFSDRPLDEALQDLSNLFDQPLLIDKKSLEDLGLDLKKGVSLQGKSLSGRTVLRAVLATQGLTFVVKDETIQIVTVERSKTLLTTRVYYLGDLVQGVGPFSDIQWGPFINQQQTQANVTALLDSIRKIDPLSWSGPDTGGPGTITYHAASQSIIVRNSAEVHASLGNAFYGKK